MFVFIRNDWRKLSLPVSLGIENFVGGENGRSEEAASILVVQLCLQLLCNEKNLMLIFTGNNAREFSHFFGRCTTPTLHLTKIWHPWLTEAPESSIWNNLLWIFHCSHSLERSFGTPNAYNYQKFRSCAHLARMQFDGSTFYPRFEILLLWIFFFTLVGVIIQKS